MIPLPSAFADLHKRAQACSAGGIGVTYHLRNLAAAYPETQKYVVSDAGTPFRPPYVYEKNYREIMANWGADTTLPLDPSTGKPVADLGQLAKFNTREFPDIRLKERNYKVTPSFDEALSYIDSLSDCLRVSFDIEVFAGRTTCIAFAKSPIDAMCVPIAHYRPTEEGILWRAIAKILGNPNIEKIGQNLAFDTMYLLQNYKIHTKGHICDTMVAHKLLYQDYPKGLDFLVSMHCGGEPYYKDEGKIWKQSDVNDWPAFYRDGT